MAGKQSFYNSFHKKLLPWYERNRRQLPWRTTRNPYRIIVSEIMLQQTQVRRVVEYYKRWLLQFPSFRSLANATRAEVLRTWSGLGYNNRALRLHDLARTVGAVYRQKLPNTIDELQALPGIGKYTAHAVSCFAFGQSVPVVDVNVKRILTRWTSKVGTSSETLPEKETWKIAQQFLPAKQAYHWNQALMDLGSAYCTAQRPACSECPVHSQCRSAFSKVFLGSEKRARKKEPAWKGVPRRLYRGKILRLLHHKAFSVGEITSLLWKDPSGRDINWIGTVLDQMQNDGLVERRKNRYSIAQ